MLRMRVQWLLLFCFSIPPPGCALRVQAFGKLHIEGVVGACQQRAFSVLYPTGLEGVGKCSPLLLITTSSHPVLR
jgi:hypothetical protein